MFIKYLNKKYDIKRNEVTNKIQFKSKKADEFKELDSIAFNSLIFELEGKGFKVTPQKLDMFLYSNLITSYDPFKSYFESLPPWDKKIDYIQALASTIKTSNDEYFGALFKKFIVAMVGCSYREDIVNHLVLILSGEQGCGKTTWFRNLIPGELKQYLFEGSILQYDKDTKFHLADKFLINMDELASFGKSQNEFYKALVTLNFIEQRRPYSRQTSRLMRRASFVGGTNNTEILTDLTGNRRYLCVESLSINNQNNIDINKVYSQAIYLLNNNFKYYLDQDDIKLVELENKKFLQTPEEFDLIEELFCLPDGINESVYLSASEVLDFIKENKKPHKNISVELIGKTLVSQGYKKKTKLKKYELVIKRSLSIAS